MNRHNWREIIKQKDASGERIQNMTQSNKLWGKSQKGKKY